jgi:multidrug efflux system membrane fusion protein
MASSSVFRCHRLIALGLIALLVAGCGEKPAAEAKGPGGGAKGGRGGAGGAAPVVTATAVRKPVPLVIDAIGLIESMRSASIRSQVTGTLFRIAIKEGQDVKAGDLLFELDPRPLQNAVQTAQSDLRKLRVQFEYAQGQVARYQALSAEQMVSREQYQKIQDDARALEAQVASSEALLANAKLQLEYSAIKAPVGGRTGNLFVHEGDLIRANDQTPMVTINQINPIYVTFGVPQQHLAAINRFRGEGSLKIKVTPPGTDERPEMGELTFIDNTVDASTGTIKLKGTLANEQHRLWPGQFSSVTVTLAEPPVITVPASAIQTSQTGQYLFVVTAEKIAELRPVVVERTFENEAVVAKGLNEGEIVVIDGQLRVVPGRPVEIKQPNSSPGGGRGPAGAKGGKGGDESKAKKKKQES